MARAWTFVLSHLSCWPLGWAIGELSKPHPGWRVATYCLLFSASVALVGMWGLYLAQEKN